MKAIAESQPCLYTRRGVAHYTEGGSEMINDKSVRYVAV